MKSRWRRVIATADPNRILAGPADLRISTIAGQRDLWLANGHVYPRSPHYFQPFTVLQNHGGEFYTGVSLSRDTGQLLSRRLRGRFR